MTTDLSWLIGGPQGSGVESGANIFSKVCAGIGYQVFGKREFYSNIKGEHSYFAVRISDKKIHSNVNDVHLMVAFDAEMVFRHTDEVVKGGAIIYDSDLEEIKIDEVHTLDIYVKSRLEKYLESKNKEFSIKGILETAKERGVILLPVSFREILSKLAEKGFLVLIQNHFLIL
jgi:2-oxoglutarate/2-oxoacid ferredoxin oxidoreductase subunit alpha